jgi:hypothetical protein
MRILITTAALIAACLLLTSPLAASPADRTRADPVALGICDFFPALPGCPR